MNLFPEKINVMIMAIGSPLGQSIYKAVRASNYVDKIHVADIGQFAAGLYFEQVIPVIFPLVREDSYFDVVTDYIKKNNIKLIFPTIALEHEFFAQHKNFFLSLDIKVVSCHPDVFKVCNDKFESMRFLNKHQISAPATVLADNHGAVSDLIEQYDFPLIIKPRNGVSSTDIFIVKDRERLFSLLASYPQGYFVVQQYLDDEKDYTAGVYVSSSRKFMDVIIIERVLNFGLSYSGKVILDDTLKEYCLSIAKALNSTYSINIQFKMLNNIPYCYEINPRLSSTTSIRAHFGFNEPDMVIRDMMGIEPLRDNVPQLTGSFMRYWDEIYTGAV